MSAKNNEKRRDPHPICRGSVEKRFPRMLKTTPPHYPLDTVDKIVFRIKVSEYILWGSGLE